MSKIIKDSKNVAWLRQQLNDVLNRIEMYDDDKPVHVYNNTYHIKGGDFISFSSVGFIDLDNPVDEDEEDEMMEDTVVPAVKDSLEKLEPIIRETIDKYNTEAKSKIKLMEFKPGTFIKHYDEKDVDFSELQYHKDGEHKNKYNGLPPLYTFMISGGLNGSGDWKNYLEDIKAVFEDLEKKTGLDINLQDVDNDIPDDIWTAKVLMYKKDKNIKDSQQTLAAGLKAEQETIVEYTKYMNMAKDNGNVAEVKLWAHIIKDEQEHAKEFENALKGDFNLLHDNFLGVLPKEKRYRYKGYVIIDVGYSSAPYSIEGEHKEFKTLDEAKKYIRENLLIHDEANKFQQSVDGVAKLLRKAKLQENVSFAEGDQSFKTVLVETPNDKFDEVLKILKEAYKIDSHNGKNRIFVKIEDEDTIIKEIPQEKVKKMREIQENFIESIEDTLDEAGIKGYTIQHEDPYYYVDCDSNKGLAKRIYNVLTNASYDCDIVDDGEEFYYISVKRR